MKKRGISLIALVITIVVLSIITASIIISFDDAQVVYDLRVKEDLIIAIRNDINITEKKLQIETREDLSYNDIISIVQKYGQYNVNDMSIVNNRGIQIWLYDVIQIPIQEFVNIVYQQDSFSIQTVLDDDYIVEYKVDDEPWREYTTDVSNDENELIYIRLKNPNNEVISNSYIIDDEPPTITISPNSSQYVKNEDIMISVVDDGRSGLNNRNIYEYYLSTSNSIQENGTWLPYNNMVEFNIGRGLTGTFYVHIKSVFDNAYNSTGIVVSSQYIFDNTKPNAFIPVLIDATQTSLTIQGITTDNSSQEIAYYYSIDNGYTWQTSDTFSELTPNTMYSQIKMKAVDLAGNEVVTSSISGTTLTDEI